MKKPAFLILLIVISLILLTFFGCKKQNTCVNWEVESWCEAKPGSGATNCPKTKSVYIECGNVTEGEVKVYREDSYVIYYRKYIRRK